MSENPDSHVPLFVLGYFDPPEYFENFDINSVVTPVNAKKLNQLVYDTGYDSDETRFLIDGFTNGFDIGYRGPSKIRRRAPNLKFTIGNEKILWNKVMKEGETGMFCQSL